jgi:hypothetical protein
MESIQQTAEDHKLKFVELPVQPLLLWCVTRCPESPAMRALSRWDDTPASPAPRLPCPGLACTPRRGIMCIDMGQSAMAREELTAYLQAKGCPASEAGIVVDPCPGAVQGCMAPARPAPPQRAERVPASGPCCCEARATRGSFLHEHEHAHVLVVRGCCSVQARPAAGFHGTMRLPSPACTPSYCWRSRSATWMQHAAGCSRAARA